MAFTILKFGGTSVGTYEAINNCLEKIEKNPDVKMVILSATSGTTNNLISFYKTKEKLIIDKVLQRHLDLAKQLNVLDSTQTEINNIISNVLLNQNNEAYVIGAGEYLSSLLFFAALKNKFQERDIRLLDAREVMITSHHQTEASPNFRLIKEKIASYMRENPYLVLTQGFIGSSEVDGSPTSLGRGGSDYSAAIFGNALDASELHIWTDVDGIFTIDPKLSPQAAVIPQLTFEQAAQMATAGAKIIHHYTLYPLFNKNISVFVGNTFNKNAHLVGTWIRPDDSQIKERSEQKTSVLAIALNTNQVLATVKGRRRANEAGLLGRIFTTTAKYNINVHHLSTSENSTSFTFSRTDSAVDDHFVAEIRDNDDLIIEENFSLLSLIGSNLHRENYLLEEITSLLRNHQIRMVFAGSNNNISAILLKKEEAASAAKILHTHFIEQREQREKNNE